MQVHVTLTVNLSTPVWDKKTPNWYNNPPPASPPPPPSTMLKHLWPDASEHEWAFFNPGGTALPPHLPSTLCVGGRGSEGSRSIGWAFFYPTPVALSFLVREGANLDVFHRASLVGWPTEPTITLKNMRVFMGCFVDMYCSVGAVFAPGSRVINWFSGWVCSVGAVFACRCCSERNLCTAERSMTPTHRFCASPRIG